MSALQIIAPAPDLHRLVALATDSVQADNTRRAYSSALRGYLGWWEANGRPALTREAVHAFRTALQRAGGKAGRINQALAALTKLAAEAEACGAISYATFASIQNVERVRQSGGPTGNWLSEERMMELLNKPAADGSLRGLRDRAMLALLVGSSMRRAELARCQVEQFVQRDERWVICNLTCKGNKLRTIPLHDFTANAVNAWLSVANITSGPLLRVIEKGDTLMDRGLTASGIYYILTERYAEFEVAPHDLRRTAATAMRRNGASLEAVSAQLGHSNIGTTARYLKKSESLRRGDTGIDYLKFTPARAPCTHLPS